MLITVEAEIDANGNIRLLEPIKVTKTTRAIVTLLDDKNANQFSDEKLSAFLQKPEFKNRRSYSAHEIDEQIRDARNSWE